MAETKHSQREKVFERLKQLALKHKPVIITATQPARKDSTIHRRMEPSWTDVVIVDYDDILAPNEEIVNGMDS